MKIKYKIFSIILSIIIIFISIFEFSFITYASDYTGHGGGGHSSASHEGRNKLTAEEKEQKKKTFINQFAFSIQYLACNVGAIVEHDFASILENYKVYGSNNWKEYWWKEDNIEVDDYGCITVPEDMVSSIKQALREYSEETNGYYIVSTPSIMELDPTLFSNKNMYISLQNVIKKYGIVVYKIDYGENIYINDISGVLDGTYSLCFSGTYNIAEHPSYRFPLRIYDSNWKRIYNYDYYKISFEGNNNQIYTDIPSDSLKSSYDIYYAGYLCPDRKKADGYTTIVSKDGCRIHIFKSENAMKMFDAGKRTVYFGSDFYEKDPVDITITIDDLDKYLNTDFDKYFDELRDTIISQGSNLSEQEIEKLTDSILGKLTDIDNSIGEVGDSVKETNSLLSQVLKKLESLDENVSSILTNLDNKVSSTLELDFSGIEERLDTIIASLGIISGQLDDMTVEEIESRTDNALQEMQDEFSDVGELAKTKFPLSLPWDLGKAFDKIGGGDITSGESPPEAVAMLLYDEPDKFVHTMSLYNDDGIALYASEEIDSSPDVSYFPSMEFSADSLRGTDNGSHTSAGGHEHGGGGASRWGAWHSDTGAPIFYMPVEFSQSMKIGGLLIIDLSGFEVLHSIGRLMFSVIFCMNLVHLTFKAISAGKDLLTW